MFTVVLRVGGDPANLLNETRCIRGRLEVNQSSERTFVVVVTYFRVYIHLRFKHAVLGHTPQQFGMSAANSE